MSLEKTISNLEKNNFTVHYFKNKETAIDAIIDLLKGAKSISRGGSVTIEEIGLIDRIQSEKLPYRDYKSPEDRLASLTAEYYICSTNSITEEGTLVNIDGAGNRVAAMSYGPKKIIVVTGTNKIVKNTEEAFKRIREIAAPKNVKRLNKNTPCAKTGICSNCDSPERICRKTSIINRPIPKRYHIFLIDEVLGY